jgi:endonuclease/exonuclease/phosphatase family metal-dependent hydrolase
MSRKLSVLWVLLLIAVVPSSTAMQHLPMVWPDRTDVVVMTFNIRTSVAYDGKNTWWLRRGQVEHVIREEAPDIIAIQEADPWQIGWLRRVLPGYSVVTPKALGQWRGYPTILYREKRFLARNATRIWLSAAPQVPDSVSWGNDSPRCFTTVRLYDRVTGRSFEVASTHLDYRSSKSREESTIQLAEWVRESSDVPLVLAGDFNEPADSYVLDPLRSVSPERDDIGRLQDSYRLAREPERGTLHGFSGRSKSRIDLILVSSEWQVVSSHVVEYHDGATFPSDHYPVVATIGLDAKPNVYAVR